MSLKSLQFKLVPIFLLFISVGYSQTLKQVLFSTGGSFMAPGNKVKLYSYNPQSDLVTVIDSIYGDFCNDLKADSGFAYLHVGRASGSAHGQEMIVKYNLTTLQKTDSITNIPGVQKFIITPKHLVVTYGYGASAGFVRFYDKENLVLLYSDNTLTDFTSSSTFLNDTIYTGFTHNNSGAVAIYSTNPIALNRVKYLDTLSTGMSDLANDGQNIYLLSEKLNMSTYTIDYGGVTKFNPATNSHQTTTTDYANSFIAILQDTLVADFGATDGFNTSTLSPLSFDIQNQFSEGSYDHSGKKFYLQNTDFFSFGEFLIADKNGIEINSFTTDFSGAAIALDYFGSPASIEKIRSLEIKLYPNPATDLIYLSNNEVINFKIFNYSGQLVDSGILSEGKAINVSSYAPGMYVILLNGKENHTIRFVKR